MSAPSFRVRAIYEYNSPHDDDLSFPNGQVIAVTDEEDADWYYGEYTDSSGSLHQGLFPRNFVEQYEPTTPPRPARTAHAKKTTEAMPVKAAPAQVQAAEPAPEQHDTMKAEAVKAPPQRSAAVEEPRTEPENQAAPTEQAPPAAHGAPGTSKAAPPPISEKPTGSSFRDRIAAFNKSTAAPVAPVKPGGLGGSGSSSFIKKPYVAPPPIRNSYVPPPTQPPPQKLYRREEEPGPSTPTAHDADASARSPPQSPASVDSASADQPKPTSLKERIALLQQQQLEQQARHAEAALKKEKPQRPPKKRIESHQSNERRNESVSQASQGRAAEPADEPASEAFALRPRARSTERSGSLISPLEAPQEFVGDAKEENEPAGTDTEQDVAQSAAHHRAPAPIQPARAPQFTPPNSNLEGGGEPAEGEDEGAEEEEDDDEDDIDPEVKRRMEIRERMAKMSGGMGMAGMFGPPGGLPSLGARKPKAAVARSSSDEHADIQDRSLNQSATVMTMPGMALPGISRVRSPDEMQRSLEVTKDEEPEPVSVTAGRDEEEVPDVEDLVVQPIVPVRHSEERGSVPPVPQARPGPAPPLATRAAAPPPPTEGLVTPPTVPAQSRPVPHPPSAQPVYSDTEEDPERGLGMRSRTSKHDNGEQATALIARQAPPIPSVASNTGPPPVPQGPRSPPPRHEAVPLPGPSVPTSPTTADAAAKRFSRIPPIPGAAAPTIPSAQVRVAPPPPPSQPPLRVSGESEGLGSTAEHIHDFREEEEDEAEDGEEEEVVAEEEEEEDGEENGEVYDGNTDSVAGATHQPTWGSTSQQTTSNGAAEDEASYHHEGLPSMAPMTIAPPPIPSGGAPRVVPPPPPHQPPRHSRHSSDIPRAAPPAPPPSKEVVAHDQAEEYDAYSYQSPSTRGYVGGYAPQAQEATVGSKVEEQYEDVYGVSSSRERPHRASHIPAAYRPPPPPSMPRQSLDVLRNTTGRRSVDVPRPSMEQRDSIASDVDLGRGSQWWVKRKEAPPVFQTRADVSIEFEESTAMQDGLELVSKHVYVLFMDYSQTIITARFAANKDPARAELQQRHEPAPGRLRQDQLEEWHGKYGARIAEMASGRVNTVVGSGTPFALVNELVRSLANALGPVGTRAYGALVYANLANATVQQNDEIRAGDIVSFRNAKMQGHRGAMKQKYSAEVGGPDHVAIVVDWDGTKKKVRAWEQGRESKKVKVESFKLGDLRSGEVKVWRVMSREWVGWGGEGR